MDRKGFTLVELIATIFIVSLLFGIATYSVIGIINNSKNKGEAVFIDKIEVAIDEYIGLYGSRLVKSENSYTFSKCKNSACTDKKEVSATELESIKLSYLVNEGIFDDIKLINPSNKLECINDSVDPLIRVFKDSDYVYYYYIDLSGSNTMCEISSDNGIINTLPNELYDDIGI